MQSAQNNGAAIASGTVQALHTSATGTEAELDDGRRLRAKAAIVASGAFAAGVGPAPGARGPASQV